MPSSPGGNYVKTEVLTATPQKLQFMLIEGAIRFVERARKHFRAQEDEQAGEAIIRAQGIVTELINSLNREVNPELARKIAGAYLFVFRTLLEASREPDEKKLADVLNVLEVERETWRQVCDNLANSTPPEYQTSGGPPARHAPPAHTAPLRNTSPPTDSTDAPSTGFSLEA